MPEAKEETHLEAVQRHVDRGRSIVARQEKRVASITVRRGDTSQSQSLLDVFRQTQAIFEDELVRALNGQR